MPQLQRDTDSGSNAYLLRLTLSNLVVSSISRLDTNQDSHLVLAISVPAPTGLPSALRMAGCPLGEAHARYLSCVIRPMIGGLPPLVLQGAYRTVTS